MTHPRQLMNPQRLSGPSWRRPAWALCLGWVLLIATAGSLPASEFAGITRDSFPVFNDPPMLNAQQAEAQGVIFPRDAVIGVALGGKAKAYPIAIMGFHELGNDTLDGIPIAISW